MIGFEDTVMLAWLPGKADIEEARLAGLPPDTCMEEGVIAFQQFAAKCEQLLVICQVSEELIV